MEAFVTKLAFVGLLVAICGCEDNNLVVRTKNGAIRGFIQPSTKGCDIYSFMTIPYAAPPVGKLRLKPPQAAPGWSDIRDGNTEMPFCTQVNTNDPTKTAGQEDCLYLNVYTRKLPEDGSPKLPVIVWIHGGGYAFGSGSPVLYSPKLLLNKEVVMVSINYRLGPFGFMGTGDEVIQGNMALKDQNMALRWVKENIDVFGGDPDRITIAGESAGSASIHYHLLSPMSRGLFNQAIQESGSSLGPWAYVEPDELARRTKRAAGFLNCPTDSSEKILDCLQGLSKEELLSALPKSFEWDIFPIVVFGPTKELVGSNKFMEKSPREVIQSGGMADVPLMAGVCQEEGEFIAGGLWKRKVLTEMNNDYLHIFPLLLSYKHSVQEPNQFAEKIRKYYFQDKNISEDTMAEVAKMLSDNIITWATYESVQARLAADTKSPTYFYLMTYEGEVTFAKDPGFFTGGPDYKPHGTAHMDDLYYLFLFPPVSSFKVGSPDEKMSDLMTAWWTNFVIHGTPNGDGAEVTWSPAQQKQFNLLNINLPPKMQTDFFYERMEFWKVIFDEIFGKTL